MAEFGRVNEIFLFIWIRFFFQKFEKFSDISILNARGSGKAKMVMIFWSDDYEIFGTLLI